MSDATTAPSGTAAPETTTNAAPPAEKSPNVGEPEWLPKRIEQAKRSAEAEALKTLGVDSFEAAKAAIAKARELEESKKSEIEKFAEKVKSLEPEAKKAVALAARLDKYADAELAKLSEAQKAAVLAIAGDDKGSALDAIEALRPTWNSQADAPKPLPAPASTAVATAPPPAAAAPVTNHRATWEALKETNPFLAAQYLSAHEFEIFAQKS